MQKEQNFSGALLHEPPPKLRHETVAEVTAPQDAHLHFAPFEKSIFVQKQTLLKLLG